MRFLLDYIPPGYGIPLSAANSGLPGSRRNCMETETALEPPICRGSILRRDTGFRD
jgi:hypothetical protein